MSDNFVTCRHCGVGMNYRCDHEDDDVPADEVAALRERIALDNAVCLCGCPASEHEMVDEGAEQCEHEDHECLRVAPAVLEIVGCVRLALAAAEQDRDEARTLLDPAVVDAARALAKNAHGHPDSCCYRCNETMTALESRAIAAEARLAEVIAERDRYAPFDDGLPAPSPRKGEK